MTPHNPKEEMANPDPKDELKTLVKLFEGVDLDWLIDAPTGLTIHFPNRKAAVILAKAIQPYVAERERVARENNLPSDCPTHGSGRFTHCCIANLNYNRQLQGGDNDNS